MKTFRRTVRGGLIAWRHVACMLAASALVGGCAHYQAPPGATSRIKFVGQTTYAYIDTGASCTTRMKIDSKMMDSVPIADGKPIHVEHGNLVYQGTCTAAVTFVPQADTTYVSEYSTDQSRCRMRLYRLRPDGGREAEPSVQNAHARFCL